MTEPTELKPGKRSYILPGDVLQMVDTLRWLHQGHRNGAVIEAICRYYASDGERAREIQELVEGAADA